jgi:CubicO group peptidase (beta-lactamase class C family)
MEDHVTDTPRTLHATLGRVAITVAAALSAAAPLARQAPALPAAKIDAVVAAEQARQKIPGLSVAVAVGNRLVYSRGFGVADLEHGVPVKPSTAFRTASIAKSLTAAAAMALVEAGRLDLDAPVRTYCPAWPETHPPVTTRQLLGHLGGVRHYTKRGESTGKAHYFTLEDSLDLFKSDPLLHPPGSRYAYSTYGFSVVGCAIEGASGRTYEAFVRERVFGPAGMERTRLDRVYEIVPDRARGYQVLTQEALDTLPPSMRAVAKAGAVYNADLHDTSMKVPGGGLLSTAEDLVRFGIALNTGTILKKDTIERMWTEQRTADGTGTGYGLGFGVQPPQDGVRRVSHSGNQAGAASFLVLLPEVGVAYAIMTNLEDAELGPISRGIANVLRDTLRPGSR